MADKQETVVKKTETTTTTTTTIEEKPATVEVDTNNGAPIVQYIVVRTDLNWSTGAVIAQACHASVSAIARTITNPITTSYLHDLTNMHKVILKAEKLDDLKRIEEKLKEANIDHHMWIERPENVATCLACSPQPKPLVQAIFRHLKLLK